MRVALLFLGLCAAAMASVLDLSENTVTIDFTLDEGDQQNRVFEGAIPGDRIALQLVYGDTLYINGWGVVIKFDPQQLRYVSGSFQAADLIPGLQVLVDEMNEGAVGAGGRVLGAEGMNVAGTGALGTLSFDVLPGFTGSTDLILYEITLSVVDSEFDYENTYVGRAVSATITGEALPFPLLVGDFNGSGKVDFDDFFIFADHFGGTDPRCDLNGSGRVDFDDFFIFADHFGEEAP